MKSIIVCGARDYKDYRRVEGALRAERSLIYICFNGGAPGADIFADSACRLLQIPKERIDAKWKEEGKAAGPIRNQKMMVRLLESPGVKEVWAFHDDLSKSKGTKDMVRWSLKNKVLVRLYDLSTAGWTKVSGV